MIKQWWKNWFVGLVWCVWDNCVWC